MQACDVMTKSVVTISRTAPLEEAARLMIEHRISGIPVVDDHGTVIGIITEGDLLRRSETGTDRTQVGWLTRLLAPGRMAHDYVRAHSHRVEDVMTQDIVSARPDSSLGEVVAMMESRGVRRIPVIEHDRLIGIVSRADLIHALVQLLPAAASAEARVVLEDADIHRRILRRMKEQPWALPRFISVTVTDGTVVLKGVVTDQREHRALQVLAETTPGVKALRDELVWVEPVTGMLVEEPARGGDQAAH
jgi:CBS domain-containing protein